MKNKPKLLALLLATLLSVTAIDASASLVVDDTDSTLQTVNMEVTEQTMSDSNFKYVVVDGSTKITEYVNNNQATEIEVPDTLGGESVTIIGAGAFSNANGKALTKINLPNSITEIGDNAFSDCGDLTTINLPEQLKKIGANAFSRCPKLGNLTFPDTVTSVGASAFERCSSLETVELPSGLKTIDKNAFKFCSALKTISLPNGLETIGTDAFAHCKSLEFITIPDTVTGIMNGFSGCSALKKIDLPKGITTIGGEGFVDCTALVEVNLPPNLTEIESAAFAGCVSLEEITIPDTVNTIGRLAFAMCISLKEINLPEGITTIGKETFQLCTALGEIKLPSTVETIGTAAFFGTGLRDIELPDSVTSIGQGAFAYCEFTSYNLRDSIAMAEPDTGQNARDSYGFSYQRGPSIYAVKVKDKQEWYVDLTLIDEAIDISKVKSVKAAAGDDIINDTITDLSTISGTYDEQTGIVTFTSDPKGKKLIYEYQVQDTEAGKTNLMDVTVKIDSEKAGYTVTFDKDGVEPLKVVHGNKYKGLPTLSKPGYTAVWNTQADGKGTDITKDSIVTIADDHTLYPKYTAINEDPTEPPINPDKPENPDDFNKPESPDKPENPDVPNKPDKPVNPDNQGRPGEPNEPSDSSKPVNPDNAAKSETPQTGDASNLLALCALLITSGGLLIAIGVRRKRGIPRKGTKGGV